MLLVNQPALTPGFMVVHANLPEQLRALCTSWMAAYPLRVFEPETILVQSNGIAQWLKLALAAEPEPGGGGGLGIASGLSLAMPHRFVWQLYRWVLPDFDIPQHCAFDKDQLHWRLLRLLPELLQQDEFAVLAQYLAADQDQRKADQLALKLADLFDQYQVYRADWLLLWQQQQDVVTDAHGQQQPLPAETRWQAALWRAILADLQPQERQFSRAALQQAFLQRARQYSLQQRPAQLPRRVILFGISSMSQQSLEALAAIAPYTQILLAVHNPCQHFWADIIADKDLFRGQQAGRTRQQPKPGAAGHPLLAAWGKQGRDYIRLLDQFDQTEQFRLLFRGERIDLFSDYDTQHLLGQLQQDILELRDLAESRQYWPALTPQAAGAICFARCHSVVRELEVLHDDLLAQMQADPSLNFSDFMVMVPDINEYAAAIHAVFGRYRRDDDRYIPFTIADQAATVQQPMLQALHYLLNIRTQRFYVSDIIDLLQVPELAATFDLDELAVQRLSQWLMPAGAQWGLHSEQRQSLGIRFDYEQFSLLHALQRMLLGYAYGDLPAGIQPQEDAAMSVAPLAAVAGLEAEHAGQLALLLQQLDLWWRYCAEPQTPDSWYQALLKLIDQFFAAQTEQGLLLTRQLKEELLNWQQACTDARLTTPLALSVVASAWLGQFEKNSLQQRFLSGAVNFASLLPMRAIPFRQVHLLGMQDGAFPRVQRRQDFDLMALHYRPGDRSRRDDDRYLLLEALLSARQRLRISWLGRSIHDNSEREPSVLVAQLRQHLARGWQLQGNPDPGALLALLTEDYPLKPYGQRYLSGELKTWQREWRSFYQPAAQAVAEAPLPLQVPEQALDLVQLQDFLRDPVRYFFQQRLKVSFRTATDAYSDEEAFELDGLANWQLQQQLLSALEQRLRAGQVLAAELPQLLNQQLQQASTSGLLPVGAAGQLIAEALHEHLPAQLSRFHRHVAASNPLQRDFQLFTYQTEMDFGVMRVSCKIQDWLKQIRQDQDGQCWQLHLQAEALQRDGIWQLRPLLAPWLALLLSAASGTPIRQKIVAPDGEVSLEAPEPEAANQILQALLNAYLQGQQQPLPFVLKLAGAWLQSKADERQLQKMAQQYDGTGFSAGLVQQNPYLSRAFADFVSFWQPEKSPALAEALLQPLLTALNGAAFTATDGER